MRRHIAPEVRAKVTRASLLRPVTGRSAREIASRYNVSPHTVTRWALEAKADPKRKGSGGRKRAGKAA